MSGAKKKERTIFGSARAAMKRLAFIVCHGHDWQYSNKAINSFVEPSVERTCWCGKSEYVPLSYVRRRLNNGG